MPLKELLTLNIYHNGLSIFFNQLLTCVSIYSNITAYRNFMDGIKEISGILSRIEDQKLILDLLECLLTENEIKEIAGRWELVKMLDKGVSQRKIAQKLSMSLCKITRGSRELKKKDSAFKRALHEYL